jgi:uncharacterized protein involved in outer membrane biogenesis
MNPHAEVTPRWRILRIALPIAAALLLAYVLTGFLVAPWLAKRELPRFAQEQLHLRAGIGELAFNPFTLTLRVADFALEEEDGRPLLDFREAVVDLEWRSLLRRAWVLSEMRVVEPSLRVEISKQGQLNLAALAAKSSSDVTRSEPVRFDLGHIAVENGRIDFEDRREGYKNRLERLSLELWSLSTLNPDKGPYALVAQTRDGATLRWQGELSLAPLAASGTLAFERGTLPELNPYLNDFVIPQILSGRADLELPYEFMLVEGKPKLDIHGAKLVLHELALAARGTETPFAKLGQVVLEGMALDLQSRRASVKAVHIADLALALSRDAKGELNLTRLFARKKKDPATADAGPDWQVSIARVEVANGNVSFADRGSGVALRLERASAKLDEVSSDETKPLTFELASAVGSGGRIAARGRVIPATGTFEARIEASEVPLAPLQPLLAQYASVKLTSGELSLAGDLRAGGESPKLAYVGSASAANVAIHDAAGARLLAWKSLATSVLRVTLEPNRAEIDELLWSVPVGKLAIAADHTTNIGRVFRRAAPAPALSRDQEKPDEAGGFAVAVRRVRIERGGLAFSDESLRPGFAESIRELSGTVNGVSSDHSTRSQFLLEGRVDRFGFARLSGVINPFAPRNRTNFRVQFRNLDVAKVSPYSMKFAGYRIASGRMSLDLNYRVRDNLLEGDNKIVLDQFTLGERVESPNALKLPLELAVALLKDANGRIDVAVPISGNLDDPQFSYGTLLWKAIGNLVTRVVAAPFRTLAHLLGGSGEEVGTIAFDPGSSRLLPPEQEKLGQIVEALNKRAELKLVIPARYDAEVDARALKRAALRREVAKRAGFAVAKEDDPGPISFEDRRTRSALRALFAERFSAPELDRLKAEAEANARAASGEGGKQQSLSAVERLRNFASGEPQVVDASEFYRTLIRRLTDAQPLPADALPDLAQRRAAAIAAALAAAGADPARITQSTAEPTKNAEAKQVTVQLALTTLS